ncbi:LAME_0C06348g1_1 [Lachancea meyersii CBS 8951]|uniref:LAME_0C06348g1_1 n=1 Tax=Lachancea meyersii CBS 8951 TaxID=1266667 RepID=A0A1G4J2X0_9SACH|nr:LAME_0C06348g1_1 [Lachancea meyersii CBS 8951]
MKTLRWSGRGRKSSTATSDNGENESPRGHSAGSPAHSGYGHRKDGQSTVTSLHSNSTAKRPTVFGKNLTSSPSLYLSENSSKSSRSLASIRDVDDIKNDTASYTTSSHDDCTTFADERSALFAQAPAQINASSASVKTKPSLSLNGENYDNHTFKIGWVNKAASAQVTNNRDSRVYGNGASLDPQSLGRKSISYRLHRASLKGTVLNLYKSGIGNVKFFDPNLAPPSHLADQAYKDLGYSGPTTPTQQQHLGLDDPETLVERQQKDLAYLSSEYPHPELKLDKDGRLLSGSNESICHMVLFCPPLNDEHARKIIDVLLILPLIDRFGTILAIFQLFGVTFTRHRAKLVNSARQHHQISPKADSLMTERLALVVKVVLDVFSGFLLDDKLFSQIVDLVDVISLHDDEISTNLKMAIVERQNNLSQLCAFSKQKINVGEVRQLTSVENFLNCDQDDFVRGVHQINLKFLKEWSPQMDYSLLYDSRFNENHVQMNPTIFKNSENVHFLGRLLVSHLFTSRANFSPEKTAEVLSAWVQLGCKFEKIGDMVSWLAVATIVCSIPVLRLVSTWQFVAEQTLRVIFKDWVPTIVQLDRRQIASKSTNSVFILAPPNLNNASTRENVIPFFGDLSITANDLPPETKFKYLEKKIHRTKNAFYKWQQRIEQARRNDKVAASDLSVTSSEYSESTASIYHYWRFHLDQEPMNIDSIMELSIAMEPPRIDQKEYSDTSSRRSALLTGSYLPMLFNQLLPTYSLFPRESLIGAAGVSSGSGTGIPLSINTQNSKMFYPQSQDHDQSGITGVENLDEPTAKELSSKVSNKQKLLKLIRDAFNIDMDMFHVSDDIVFKAVDDIDGRSRPASVVIETPKRLSQHSSINTGRDSQDLARLSSTIETLDFFSTMGKSSCSINESHIQVVLKSATLDKLFDVLVLTTSVFSKVVDTEDLENYLSHERRRQSLRAQSPDHASVGPLDYAFIRLLMDNDVFTDTFFNTYRSFTTTTIVLENLAKRFIGAVSGAVSIGRIMNNGRQKFASGGNSNRFSGFLDVTSTNSKFPAWDLKVAEEDDVSLVYVAKIQIGAMEAFLHLVSLHYSDFTDCLTNNATFLDILKIMDQEVNDEWNKRLEVFAKTKYIQTDFRDEVSELENLHSTLKTLFKRLKSCYQKQLYRPLGISKVQRTTQNYLKGLKTVPLKDLGDGSGDANPQNKFYETFSRLTYANYSGLSRWMYELDEIISHRVSLVSNQDWVDVSQTLELFSNKSLISLYQYPLHSISQAIVQSAGSYLDDLEVVNVFTWLTTLSAEDGELVFNKLPPSVQLVVKLYRSLTNFFIFQMANASHSSDSRVNTFAVVLQLLNLAHWKNSSMDLFHDNKNDKSSSAISPHVPSFIESCLCSALIAPESRYFEMFWKEAHRKLSGSNGADTKDISTILERAAGQIKNFVEFDESLISKSKNLTPCPGWLVTRLLEISQFVPNMSIENSKMINFDKRRFVNNVIINFREMLPFSSVQETAIDGHVFHDIVDIGKAFRKIAKETASTEARANKYQATGLFNSVIIAEVEKVKRDQKKMTQLSVQDNNAKRKNLLEQAVRHRNRLSTSPSMQDVAGTVVSRESHVPPEYSPSMKRSSYAANASQRSSIISNTSSHGNGSMGKKLGGFFRRPFSIGGFSSSSSAHGLNAILLSGVHPNGSISPYELPDITSSVFKDSKPLYTIRTFEIKSCIPVSGINKLPQTDYSLKITMSNGAEHIVQATSQNDMMEWLKLINMSKRYSFHSQKYKGKTSNKIFGVPIEDVCEREGSIIPNIVVKLLEEIELRGLDEMGLYRVPGSVGSINALKAAFDEEGAVSNSFTLEDDRWFEVNTIAGCFKLYLRELPDSLFTKQKLPLFVGLALSHKTNEIDYEQFKSSVRDALKSLPLHNFHMMKRTFEHLNRVDRHVENNRMDATNLAIVFSMSFIDQEDLASSMGPTLGALQTLLQSFIRKPDDFF